MDKEANLGARLRSLRRRADLSQVRLAKLLGVSPSYLNLIEHNRRRLPADLMFRLADLLHVDVREFATDETTSLRDELMEALADPVFDETDIKSMDVRDLASSNPSIARALVLLYRRYHAAQETVEKLGSLVVDGQVVGGDTRLPSEEVNDFVQRNMNHFPELEEAAEAFWQDHKLRSELLFEGLERALLRDHGVQVRIVTRQTQVVRAYDPKTRTLSLSETLPPRSRHFQMAHQLGLLALDDTISRIAMDPQLTTPESTRLARMVLANYFAGALIMPYDAFWSAAEEERYDVELLGHRFRTSFEQVAHRLTCMRRPGKEGVPFHFVKTDTAGNVSKRFSASGIGFARFSGGCPRWNVCTVFQWPGRIRRQVSQMPDGSVYFCIARTVEKRHGGFHAPETLYAIGLGCRVEHAHRLVYADGVDLERAEVISIGTNCRVCDRLGCEQRAFPSIRHRLDLDENTRRIAFYAMDDDE